MANTNEEKRFNAVVYVKDYSDCETAKKHEQDCLDFAKSNNINVLKVFSDISRNQPWRAEFEKMMNYCQKNKDKIKYVICSRFDKFSRQLDDHVKLNKYGIELISVEHTKGHEGANNLRSEILRTLIKYDQDLCSGKIK